MPDLNVIQHSLPAVNVMPAVNQHLMRVEFHERLWHKFWRRTGRTIYDVGYLAHGYLVAAFGEHAPRPFIVGAPKGGCVPLEGYVSVSGEQLQSRLDLFADAEVASIIVPETLRTKKLPRPDQWPEYVGFSVRVNPIARALRAPEQQKKHDRDWFFVAQEKNPEVTREEAYTEWFNLQLAKSKSGIELVRATLDTGEILQAARPDDNRVDRLTHTPAAQMSGILKLPSDRTNLSILTNGIGRGKAFGFGMFQLRPAR
jgi:CRISPR system Cascade subunit CasE